MHHPEILPRSTLLGIRLLLGIIKVLSKNRILPVASAHITSVKGLTFSIL